MQKQCAKQILLNLQICRQCAEQTFNNLFLMEHFKNSFSNPSASDLIHHWTL